MTRAAQIKAALEAAFKVQHLEVIDESEKHRGHAGYQEGGQSHFVVRIKSSELTPLSRLARHRAVHAAIGPALIAQIHALSIDIET
ncbi:BolA family transcriptional regulator [Rhodobacteraceae bacterium KMM 6894]|nr:BolA family transcriptional regulator [Rhodobacteraceae bacterium KMM 6894]